MTNEVRIPDVEVIVGASGNDVAVFCFYGRDDIHQGYDVVCAVCDPDARAVVRAVLQDAITALNIADWFTLDELHSDASEETADPPF